MSERMRTRHIDANPSITIHGIGLKKYKVTQDILLKVEALMRKLGIEADGDNDNDSISLEEYFKKKGVDYSKPGMLVRDLRFGNQLTQEQLAQKLGVLQTHVSEIEHNKRPIGKTLAKKLSKVFNTDYRLFL